MHARSQPVPFNWSFMTSFFLLFFGGLLLWVHFSDVLPVISYAQKAPLRILVPLHVWAVTNLFMSVMTLMLGWVSMSCPGVTRAAPKNPTTWKQYRVMAILAVVADVLLLASAMYLSFELAGWALFVVIPQLLLVSWNACLVRKLSFPKS